MAQITLIAPYPSLAELALSLCEEFDWPLEVVIGRGKEGLALAQQAALKGSNVIISRGITARCIKRETALPVVEIPITGFDMLRAYLKAAELGEPVGVADKKNILCGFKTLSEILGQEIITFELEEDESNMPAAVEFLKKRGVKSVIGKATLTKIVEEEHLNGVLLTSGREAVIQAVEEAKRALYIQQQEMARLKEIKTIVDFNDDGIILIDRDKLIRAFNPAAEKLFGLKIENIIGLPITELLPLHLIEPVWDKGQPEMGDFWSFLKEEVLVNRIPILVEGETQGMIITFQDVERIQKLEHKIRRNLISRGYVARYAFDDIVAKSKIMEETIKRAQRFAKVDSTILIYGESGSGKEMFAQAIHQASSRSKEPFVAINCAALPESLLESELFGYVEGAFTGARKGGKPGLFEQAHKGTLFLDEIGEMSERLQARVLRVLEEGQVMRLGADRLLPVDVRIITATNKNLKELVKEKKFREDLFYRLYVLNLNIPPLRLHKEDIPFLADSFMREYCRRFKKKVRKAEEGVYNLLKQYNWPGNVRELKNVMERMMLLTDGEYITVELAQDVLSDCWEESEFFSSLPPSPLAASKRADSTEEVFLIERALKEAGGNRSEAARLLGMSRTTLWRRLKKLKMTSVSR